VKISDLHGSKVTGTGSVVQGVLADLSASKVTSGTFDLARIPTITRAKIDNLAVDTPQLEDGSVNLAKVNDAIKNPAQSTAGLRSISTFLGGSGVQASASDHSHGSGNSHDFDLLPQTHRDRILLARQRVRSNIRNLDTLTAAEFRLYVRELSIVALAAFALEADAVDLTAEERRDKRAAGENLPLFAEWRVPEGKHLHDADQPRYTQGLPAEGEVPA
jgi:hypothetical protein